MKQYCPNNSIDMRDYLRTLTREKRQRFFLKFLRWWRAAHTVAVDGRGKRTITKKPRQKARRPNARELI